MDREVLFRGKRMDNGKWVEGWYCPKKTGHHEGDRFVEEMQSIIIASMTGGGYQYAVVDPKTVCQYVGYTDLRKQKAFEHDIVFYEDGGCYGHIVFKDGQFLIEWQESRPDLRSDIHFWFTKRYAEYQLEIGIVWDVFNLAWEVKKTNPYPYLSMFGG